MIESVSKRARRGNNDDDGSDMETTQLLLGGVDGGGGGHGGDGGVHGGGGGGSVLMEEYSRRMNDFRVVSLRFTKPIPIRHRFLLITEEARMERESLFVLNRDANEEALRVILATVGIAPSFSGGGEGLVDVVVASVGTSSTQVYGRQTGVGGRSGRGVAAVGSAAAHAAAAPHAATGIDVGAFFVGTDALKMQPELASELATQILAAMKQSGFSSNTPLLFVNSISFMVTRTVKLSPLLLSLEGVCRDQSDSAVVAGLLAPRCGNLDGVEMVVVAKVAGGPKLRNDWTETWMHEVKMSGATIPEFVVDFGGSGMCMSCVTPTLATSATATVVVNDFAKSEKFLSGGKQAQFVADVEQGLFESSSLLSSIPRFLQTALTSPPAQILNGIEATCSVLQTGIARQYAVLGHTAPCLENQLFV